MTNILLVEDDTTFSAIIENFLKRKGYQVEPYFTISSGIEALKKSKFDLVLLDYRLSDGNGLEVLDFMQLQKLSIPTIIMTSFSDVRTAVRAMRKGVYDYITKPVNPDELYMILQEALESSPEDTSPSLREKTVARRVADDKEYVKGNSKVANKLQEYIELVAPTDMSVLIRGESGTGKEYVAKSIHKLSNRADKPFVSIDCGTLSKELAGSELFGHIKGSFTG